MKLVYVSRLTIFVLSIGLIPSAFCQSWQWAVPVNNYLSNLTTGSSIVDVAVDKSENVYAIGNFVDSAQFGTTKVKSGGKGDFYLAKLDAAGNYVWVKDFAASYSEDEGYSVTTDSSGDVYVLGFTIGTINFGGKSLSVLGSSQVALAKLNANGVGQWAKIVDSADTGPGALAYSPTGHIYVACDKTLNKYTLTGTLVWSRLIRTTGEDVFGYRNVTADAAGNVYATGVMSGKIGLGSDTVKSQGYLDRDMFVVKYDPSGNVLWAKRGGRPSGGPDDYGHAVAVDGGGNVYVAGEYRGIGGFDSDTIYAQSAGTALFLAKYNSNGNLNWVYGSSGDPATAMTPFDLKIFSNNDLLLTVNVLNAATYGGQAFTVPNGRSDLFVMRLTKDGAVLWSKRSETASPSIFSKSIEINPTESYAYVGGTFYLNSIFGPSTLTQIVQNTDGFMAKLDLSQSTPVVEGHSGFLPDEFQLSQNYPNPFNPSTTIRYSIAKRAHVRLIIYNAVGERVRHLVDEDETFGDHAAIWDGRNDDNLQTASGVYFYRLELNDVVATKKMILLK